MTIFSSFFLILIFCLLPVISAASELRWDLEQCLSKALEKSSELEVAKRDVDIAHARIRQAKSLRRLPKLELQNFFTFIPGIDEGPEGLLDINTRNDYGTWGVFNRLEITAVQPIFTFGRIDNAIKGAKALLEVQEKGQVSKRSEIIERVKTLYYSRLLMKELEPLVEEAHEKIKKAMTTLEKMLKRKSRKVKEADLFKLGLFEKEIERRDVELKRQREIVLKALKTQLGVDEKADFDIADDFLDPVEGKVKEVSYYQDKAKSRPELRQLSAGIRARQAQLDIEEASYYPQFFLAAQVTYMEASGRPDVDNPYLNDIDDLRGGVFLGMKLPLNFSRTNASVQLARGELQKLQAQEKAATQGIDVEVSKAYQELVLAKEKMKNQRASLKLARKWLTAEQITYDIDASNAKDLLESLKAYLAGKAQHMEAVYEYNRKYIELDRKAAL